MSVLPGEDSKEITIIEGDNLDVLKELRSSGKKFDVVELDGPYMAGIPEPWDDLELEEYIDHYAKRFREILFVLEPWGLVVVFGYPENLAELKVWSRTRGVLNFRRWLTWDKKRTVHNARLYESVLVFSRDPADVIVPRFRECLREKRKAKGWTIARAMEEIPSRAKYAGKGAGMLWFESENSKIPGPTEYRQLKEIFEIPDLYDSILRLYAIPGITEIDRIDVPHDAGLSLTHGTLRSKSVALYDRLFWYMKPWPEVKPDPDLLVLYGGSGNAAISGSRCGYNVTIVEKDPGRCAVIRDRWNWFVNWRAPILEDPGPLFAFTREE